MGTNQHEARLTPSTVEMAGLYCIEFLEDEDVQLLESLGFVYNEAGNFWTHPEHFREDV